VRDVLVYERVLTPGPGTSLYGLEVARAMHVPQEYYEKALKYRKAFLGENALEDINKSTWNSHILRDKCELCGLTTGLEVHHIRQRKDAIGSHFEDGESRDDARNLIVVCGKCHDAHHNGYLNIAPIKMTTDGPIRIDMPTKKEVTPKKQRKSQWLPEQREIIEKLLMEYTSSPLKRIIVLLKEEGIIISESSLRSIRNTITQ
jgi:hypothetical protein